MNELFLDIENDIKTYPELKEFLLEQRELFQTYLDHGYPATGTYIVRNAIYDKIKNIPLPKPKKERRKIPKWREKRNLPL